MHTDISTLRDPFTNKPYVGFYSTGRAGGTFWDPKAVLLLKSDNA
jgi:HK97 family phage major capsid protein